MYVYFLKVNNLFLSVWYLLLKENQSLVLSILLVLL